MSLKEPLIHFWLPSEIWPSSFPESAEKFMSRKGYDSWIVQTYLRLKESGFNCEKVSRIPEEGIVVTYREFLPYEYRPNPQQLLICVKADKNPHPYAQIHITHNYSESKRPNLQIYCVNPEEYYLLWGPRYYIPHWPQPGLIPRNLERGNRIQNVAYYGISFNLAPELKTPEWRDFLHSLGLNWIVEQRRNYWHNYDDIDVVVAARDFTNQSGYPWKPASKLFNSWRAGVPAVLGAESAFQSIRKNELDFLEIRSYEDAKQSLLRLRDEPGLYGNMRENSFERASEVSIDRVVKQWTTFLLDTAVPMYEDWKSKSSLERRLYFLGRASAQKASRLQRYILKRTESRKFA
ncbi:MAG: hypothetical protein AAF810_24575 [Cyanobacteria bacterium P01_D01_bin.36]